MTSHALADTLPARAARVLSVWQWRRRLALGLAQCLAGALAVGLASPAMAEDANALRAHHAALKERLANSPFQRPLVIESNVTGDIQRGDVYAVVPYSEPAVAAALQGSGHWCELLMLHLNVKQCAVTGQVPNETITMAVGRKFDQPAENAFRVNFRYKASASEDLLRVQMLADTGPMSTHDYRLSFDVVALDPRSSFVHMAYAYSDGFVARMAMDTYLATIGRSKVGFSVVGHAADGSPTYVDGLRGVIERNTMRYYLAIEAYLGALSVPPAEQADKRLRDWFDATERHARQLHEMDRGAYLDMKHHELRANAAAPGARASGN